MTLILRDWFGVNLYGMGFNLLSFWGLTLTYLFFPDTADGADHHARAGRAEAGMAGGCFGAGATGWQYWRMVALPILFPSLLGTFALLFANSFGRWRRPSRLPDHR